MKCHSALRGLLAICAAAALAAGCAAPTAAPTVREAPLYHPLQAPGMGQQQQQPPDVTEIFPFLKGIGLKASQKTQIMTLLQQQQPATSQEDAQQQSQRFLSLLSRRTLDKAALRAYFSETEKASRQQTLAIAKMFSGLRKILTATQRGRAAQKIRDMLEQPQQQPDQGQGPPQDQQGQQQQQLDLKLTAKQQQAFQAMSSDQDPKAGLTALATFFEDGDLKALQAAMLGETTAKARVDASVAAYSSLSYQQRRKLVNHLKEQQQQAEQQAQQSQQQPGREF